MTFLFADNECLSKYADDTTLYSIGKNHNTNRKFLLNKNLLSLQKWFYDTYMVLNPGKCCYTSFGSNPDKSDLILVVTFLLSYDLRNPRIPASNTNLF